MAGSVEFAWRGFVEDQVKTGEILSQKKSSIPFTLWTLDSLLNPLAAWTTSVIRGS
ncbi:hypothetical protein [Synechococcus sp. BIOS-E4-1]|uniref:hypothetical protein n=1 Tax=Synechococcus sp. BIOS-E4-1 TaxID=1400864 RepID=UPI001645E5B2|nr:hypothetical protein [Synechococcus sp. BIOS-E4-1]